ncbi:hypothetical protein THICB2_10020 [Thiomonas sp. CB2]|nr:hypothetical protein THICB2_10020 [Thiomonas sp. CB2]VDY06608.1 protein of unknown function [Thiomonas sp. Bio17B3]VDY10096.1 protein of unknown function [Thiomonas sp. Sup16B3]VDY14879.1 conserved protein of unknown function [Thiomonas sp. OC7]VDY15941.1 protein of unknown function [Thiomonas sp. CB2]
MERSTLAEGVSRESRTGCGRRTGYPARPAALHREPHKSHLDAPADARKTKLPLETKARLLPGFFVQSLHAGKTYGKTEQSQKRKKPVKSRA